MTPADVLRKAADYIAEHGWVQGQEMDCDGGVCAEIAIAETGCFHTCRWDDRNGCAKCAINVAFERIGYACIVDFNDNYAKSAEEVISTLRTVADRLDSAPDRDRGEGEA